MRCIVTGGSGFIGRHVTSALRNAGHEVAVLDVADDADYRVDIRDSAAVTAALAEWNAEVVFHIAGIADARRVLTDPTAAVAVTVGGTANVLDACRRCGVRRVVLASTCWVANAMGTGILDERSPFNHSGGGHVYTTTKIASEFLMHDFRSLYGLDYTILRYGVPYGPGMWEGLVLQNWLTRAISDQPITILGDGSASRRFVFVDDLADAHVLALRDVAANQIYNLEGMRAVTIAELARVFERVWGQPLVIEYRSDPSRVGELETAKCVLSNAKAYVHLGWQPSTDLEEGIRRTVTSFRGEVSGDA